MTSVPPISDDQSWLVVLTILKNISQWKGLSHILWIMGRITTNQKVINLQPHHGPIDRPTVDAWTRTCLYRPDSPGIE